MPPNGTTQTFRHVNGESGFGGEAQNIRSLRALPLMTRLGHPKARGVCFNVVY